MKEYSLERAAAYEAINGERDYQDKVWGASESSGNPGYSGARTIDEFSLYIHQYAVDLAQLCGHTS